MRCAWLLLLVAGVASAGPRKGKVVRIERAPGAGAPPIICDVAVDHQSNCLGDEPKPGDVITLLDENGNVGEARLTEVTPYSLGRRTSSGGCDGLWQGKTEMIRGDLGATGNRVVGIIDPTLTRRAHLVPKEQLSSPSGRSDDTPALGFDRDGDHVADVVVSQGSCDASGSVCIDMWARINGTMQRVRQVNFNTCGF